MADGRWQMADGRWQMNEYLVPAVYINHLHSTSAIREV
jgi:hypothetical protein